MKGKYLNIGFTLILLFLILDANSQAKQNLSKMDVDDANEHYKHKNYIMAIPIYRNEVKKDPNNDKLKIKLAECLLYSRINREEGVSLLEKVVKNDPKNEEAWRELGRGYHLTNKLDQADAAYRKYIALKPKKEEEIAPILEQINNARFFMANPANVTFQNLGPEINTDEPDYYPFVSADETFLVFTSRRKENIGGKKIEMDGFRSSDVWFSKVENGKWTKAANAGKIINSAFDEQAVGIKSDGSEIVLYIDLIDKFGDLYTSKRKNGTEGDFTKYVALDPVINKEIETTGSFCDYGDLFIFSRREKIDGQSDLYMCKKLPNGKWGLPFKLPPNINTSKNEDFPFLSGDCTTLYFASEGHNSMGGYDLFKTKYDLERNTFSDPVNLGYPINSTDDDRSICVTPDNRVAYVSAFRPGGFGELDIYRIKFNDKEQISRIITGNVFLGDTLPQNQPKEIVAPIIVTNKQTKEEYTFVPHRKTGRYVISLPAGEYSLLISISGYKTHKEELSISDIGKTGIESSRNFILKRKE